MNWEKPRPHQITRRAMRIPLYFLVAALVALVLPRAPAQVATIGVKGRTREAGSPRRSQATASPTHRLPRRAGAEEIVIPPNPDEVERERMREALGPPPPLAEDRTRSLVRRRARTSAPPPLVQVPIEALYTRPRRGPGDGSLAGILPSFAGGFGVLKPGAGLRRIYPDVTLFSGFLNTRFLF